VTLRIAPAHGFQPAINVTPFIDVLMVLLMTFFTIPPGAEGICGQAAETAKGVNARTAHVASKTVRDLSPQLSNVILVAGNGVIVLNSQRVNLQSLPAKLAPTIRPGVPVFITAGGNTTFQDVAAVINAARAAGAVEFALLRSETPVRPE
jgi:biopolymer transport protein ExbD